MCTDVPLQASIDGVSSSGVASRKRNYPIYFEMKLKFFVCRAWVRLKSTQHLNASSNRVQTSRAAHTRTNERTPVYLCMLYWSVCAKLCTSVVLQAREREEQTLGKCVFWGLAKVFLFYGTTKLSNM